MRGMSVRGVPRDTSKHSHPPHPSHQPPPFTALVVALFVCSFVCLFVCLLFVCLVMNFAFLSNNNNKTPSIITKPQQQQHYHNNNTTTPQPSPYNNTTTTSPQQNLHNNIPTTTSPQQHLYNNIPTTTIKQQHHTACHPSCKGACDGEGASACRACKEGWVWFDGVGCSGIFSPHSLLLFFLF